MKIIKPIGVIIFTPHHLTLKAIQMIRRAKYSILAHQIKFICLNWRTFTRPAPAEPAEIPTWTDAQLAEMQEKREYLRTLDAD